MSGSIKLHTMDLFSRFFQENQEKFGSADFPGWQAFF